MAITLVLKPETEARLIAQADSKGVPVEQYLQSLIEMALLPETIQNPPHEDNTDNSREWVKLLDEFCNHPALANVPPLSDEAISRESIYREREDSQL
jgi:hypothetical protein